MTDADASASSDSPSAPALTLAEAACLRAAAQTLEPAVRVGKAGVTPTLIAELERAFAKSELVKVKVIGDRDQRRATAAALATATHAALAGGVGSVFALYRPRP